MDSRLRALTDDIGRGTYGYVPDDEGACTCPQCTYNDRDWGYPEYTDEDFDNAE